MKCHDSFTLRLIYAELVVPVGLDISGDEGRQEEQMDSQNTKYYKLELRMHLGHQSKKAHLSIYHDS